jgi:hypothetical protein
VSAGAAEERLLMLTNSSHKQRQMTGTSMQVFIHSVTRST